MALAPFKQLTDGPTMVRGARYDDIGACLATIDAETLTAVGWSGHAARRMQTAPTDDGAIISLFVIVDTGLDEVVGVVQGALDLTTVSSVRLGGWVRATHRGHGHMRRAAVMITDHYVRHGISVRAEVRWDDEAARAVLLGAGLTVEGEDDAHHRTNAFRRVAFGRYVDALEPLEPVPPLEETRTKITRLRNRRRFLLILIAAVCGLLAFLLVAPMWEAEDGVSCGRLLRPATGLTGRADSFCEIGRIVWGSMVLIAVMLLIFLSAIHRFTDPRAKRSRSSRLRDGDTAVRTADSVDAIGVVDTIDNEVLTEMGWTSDHVPRIAANVGSTTYGGLFIVTTTADKRPIGGISVSYDPGAEHLHRIGFWMHPDHRRHGHMTRALRLVADFVATFDAVLIAETATTNLATHTVLERAGFERTGTRRALLPNRDTIDAIVYER